MSRSRPDLIHEIKADNLQLVKTIISKHSSTFTHLCRYKLLTLATLHNSTNVAKYLLMMNYEVNYEGKFSDTPLHFAASHGNVEVLSMLLDRGAFIDAVSDSVMINPLYLAVDAGHERIAEMLLSRSILKGTEHKCNKNLLHAAVRKGVLKIVTSLIENGADINAVYECNKYDDETLSGFSLLHSAVYFKNEEISKFLLCHGADVNFKDSTNKCPIFFAIQNGDYNITKLLLNNGAELNNDVIEAFDKAVLKQFLFKAVLKESVDIIELILQHNRNFCINGTVDLGRTPLHCAALKKDEKSHRHCIGSKNKKMYANDSSKGAIAKILFNRAADGYKKCKKYCIRPVMGAVTNGFKKVVEVVAEFNVNANEFNVNVNDDDDDDGRSALHFAVLEGNEEVVEMLLKSGRRFDTKNNCGETPLHVAAKHGFLNIVKLLLSSGVDLEIKDISGKTALHFACIKGHEEVVKYLAEFCQYYGNKGHNTETKFSDFIDNRDDDLSSPLMFAAGCSNANIVDFLLNFGANINSHDGEGRTALHIATKHKNLNIVKLLLKHGADYMLKDKKCRTVLYLACKKESKNIVEFLLEFDRTLNENRKTQNSFNDFINCGNIYQRTPLMIAVEASNKYIIDILLKFGANINSVDRLGGTALHTAVKYGRLNIIKLLLKNGADYKLKDNNGKSVLHVACEKESKSTVKLLLEFDRTLNENRTTENSFNDFINSADIDQCTPLMIAAKGLNENIIDILLKLGANINYFNCKGRTALHIAVKYKRLNIIKLLLKNGPDYKLKDNKGRTVLHLACKEGLENIVENLLEIECTLNENRTTENSFNGFINSADIDQCTPLMIAAKGSNENIINVLLKFGANINSANGGGRTALHISVEWRNFNITKLLLKNGADYKLKDKNGKTVLHVACEERSINIVKNLLEIEHTLNENRTTENSLNDFINSADIDQCTPLMIAAKGSNENIIDILLKLGANINSFNCKGRTALHIAVKYKRLNIMKLLLKNGADFKLKDKKGRTVLHLACEEGLENIVENLLEIERTLNENKTTENSFSDFINSVDIAQRTPLMISVQNKYEKICKMLLDCGAKTNLIDIKGRTLLHFAVKSGSLSTVKSFLKYGFEYKLKDNKGQTALHLACKWGYIEIIKFLLEFDNAGGNEYVKFNDGFLELINCKNEMHLTPLMVATEQDFDNAIRILFNFGADTEAVDCNGRTALHIAVENSCFDSFDTLLKLGSDINATTNDGVTPLSCQSFDSLFPEDREEFLNILENHFHKYKAAALYMHDKNLQFYHEIQTLFYNGGQTGNENSSYFNNCVVEVNRLKTCFVINGISFYDVITKSKNKLARWANNKNFVHSMNSYNYKQEFPIYAYIIINRFKMGVKRNCLIKECILHLNSVVSSEFLNLPFMPIDNILAFLNNDDLERLIVACKSPIEILLNRFNN